MGRVGQRSRALIDPDGAMKRTRDADTHRSGPDPMRRSGVGLEAPMISDPPGPGGGQVMKSSPGLRNRVETGTIETMEDEVLVAFPTEIE